MQQLDKIKGLLEEIQTEHDKVKATVDALNLKVMSVKQCGTNIHTRLSHYEHATRGRYEHGTLPPTRLLKEAESQIQAVRVKNEDIHEDNREALGVNNKIYTAVHLVMVSVGIPAYYSTWDYKTTRSRKQTESKHLAGWSQDLTRVCVRNDGFDAALKRLNTAKVELQQECAKLVKEAAEKEQARVAELKQKADIVEAIAFLKTQGLEVDKDYKVDDAVERARNMRQTDIELLNEKWNDAICGDLDGFKEVSDKPIDTWRWGTVMEIVVRNIKTGKQYVTSYRMQPEMGLDDTNFDIEWSEVTG